MIEARSRGALMAASRGGVQVGAARRSGLGPRSKSAAARGLWDGPGLFGVVGSRLGSRTGFGLGLFSQAGLY